MPGIRFLCFLYIACVNIVWGDNNAPIDSNSQKYDWSTFPYYLPQFHNVPTLIPLQSHTIRSCLANKTIIMLGDLTMTEKLDDLLLLSAGEYNVQNT